MNRSRLTLVVGILVLAHVALSVFLQLPEFNTKALLFYALLLIPLFEIRRVYVTGYTHYPKRSEIFYFALIVLLWAFAGYGYGLLKKYKFPDEELRRQDTKNIFLFLLTITFLEIPQIFERFSQLLQYQHPDQWDFNNILNWKYARHLGLKVFADYWYPYGVVSGALDEPTHQGVVFTWLHGMMGLSYLTWAIPRI
ncbi:MAG: hypothetical protein AB7F59_04260 [Bdellovibrionales bacterium]